MSLAIRKFKESKLMPATLTGILLSALTMSTAANATILSYDLTVPDNFSGVYQSPTLGIAKGTDLDGLVGL